MAAAVGLIKVIHAIVFQHKDAGVLCLKGLG